MVGPSGGSWAARASGSGTAASAWASLPGSYSDVRYELRFNVLDKASNSVNLFRALRKSGGSIAGISVSPTGWLTLRNDLAGVTTTSATTVSQGQWHTVRLRLRIDGSALTEVWLNGQVVADLTISATLGTTPASRIQIGETVAGRTYDVAFDDVTVSMPAPGP